MQAFIPAKIKRAVERAAKEAGVAPTQIGDLIADVAEPVIELYKKKRVVKTSELRRSLLGRLERRAKKVSVAWKKYDKKIKNKKA